MLLISLFLMISLLKLISILLILIIGYNVVDIFVDIIVFEGYC